MRSVIVTGASGFIGYHTVEYFVSQNSYVYAFIHKSIRPELKDLESQGKVTIMKCDITNRETLNQSIYKLNNIDAIIHCAGRASDVGWESEFIKTNFDSVKYLVDIIKQININKLVFLSTTDVYGLRDFNDENEDQLDYDTNPTNYYPKYKILAEKWIKDNLDKDRYCILRPGVVWGINDETITKRVKDFLSIFPFIIHFGKHKGNNIWPLVHVEKVAKACYMGAFLPKTNGLEINIVDDIKYTIDDFYRSIAKTHFPDQTFRTIYLPGWIGASIGVAVSYISNMLNLSKPFLEPSLYAYYSVSRNLNFSGRLFSELQESMKKS